MNYPDVSRSMLGERESPQGIRKVAGGNAPGIERRLLPTLEGSNPDCDPFRVFSARCQRSGGGAPGY